MKKIKSLPFAFLFICTFANLHTFAQQSLNAGGNNATSTSGSVSYSIGQISYQEHSGVNGSRLEGVQLPHEVTGVISVTSVTLNKTRDTLSPDQSLQLYASILPENATNQNVTWASSNVSVATVNSSGNVTALSEGSTTITVTTQDGNHSAICEIVVVQTSGIKDYDGIALDCQLYPNPTTDVVHLRITNYETGSTTMQYVLTDLTGKQIRQQRIVSEHTEISMSNLQQGIYLLNIIVNNQLAKAFKIVKN
jgi:transglutaminase/protease-like cytokinesis protein 3